MELTTNECVFKIMEKVKQTRVGTHIQPIVFKSYPNDEKLCVIAHLKEYIERTTPFRNASKQLLLTCEATWTSKQEYNLQMVQNSLVYCRGRYNQV